MPSSFKAHRWAWAVRLGRTRVQRCCRDGCGWVRMWVEGEGGRRVKWAYRNLFSEEPYKLLRAVPGCSKGRVIATRAWRAWGGQRRAL